jgi:hypothetical protein
MGSIGEVFSQNHGKVPSLANHGQNYFPLTGVFASLVR